MNLPWGWAFRSKRSIAAMILGLGVLILSPRGSIQAKVYYAKDEALRLAFPDADSVEPRTFILNDGEVKRGEKLARTRIDSKLFTFYVGWKEGGVTGYAAIESHTVRTLPETILVVLSPEGDVRSIVILAFHEPPDYLPSDRWLSQFEGKESTVKLQPGQDIAGIVGSTLTAQAVSRGVRKVIALFQILVKEKQ